MSYFLGFLACAALGFAFWMGAGHGLTAAAEHCKLAGQFIFNEQLYECRPIPPKGGTQ